MSGRSASTASRMLKANSGSGSGFFAMCGGGFRRGLYSSSSIAPLRASGHVTAPGGEAADDQEERGVTAEHQTTLPPFERIRVPAGERREDARPDERIARRSREESADRGGPLPERGSEAQKRFDELREGQ